MTDRTQLHDMSADELCLLALELMSEVQAQQHIVDRTEAALRFSDAKRAQLTRLRGRWAGPAKMTGY
jgi:transposase